MSHVTRRSLVVAAMLLLSGCIGATDRSDFDAEVRSRGGGVSVAWITESFDIAATSVGGVSSDDLRLLSFSIDPSNRTTTVTARRVDRPEFVDVVIVRQGKVTAVSPIQDADDLPLDDLTIEYTDLPIDRIEELTDRALAEFDEDDGYVSSIRVDSAVGEATLRIALRSARQTADALFAQDGTFQEVAR